MISASAGPGHMYLQRPSPPELYKDCRLGKYDLVVWGRPNGDVKIGRIEKLSKVTKRRTDDGAHCDQCGDPHFYYVYPKFHPDENIFKIRPIELKISDRYLKVGFLVKEYETGRVGYVQGLKQQITVKLLDYDLIIRDVEFRELTDPWKLNVQYKRPVYYNGWVGRISCPIQRRVWLRFIDRRVRAFSFSIPWNELAHILIECGIVKMATFSFESSGFAFWPGKKYKIPKSLLTSAKYNIQWDGDIRPQVQENDGLVVIRIFKTEVMPFRIQWSKRIPGFNTDRPKDVFSEEEIKNLVFIRPVQTACLGDVRMYRIKADDYQNLITEETWKMVLRRRHWLPRSPAVACRKKPDDEEAGKPTLSPLELNEELPVEVIYTRSTAEVAWADGKISRVDSSKVCRVRSEYFETGTFVEPITLPGINTFGVIQEIKIIDKVTVAKDISAVVKWFYFGNDEDPEEQTYETELPIKLLRGHSKFNYKSHSCMNVIVTRALKDQEFTVGYVVNTYPDGKVRVRCVDGSVRRFWPFEINRIYLDSGDFYSPCNSREKSLCSSSQLSSTRSSNTTVTQSQSNRGSSISASRSKSKKKIEKMLKENKNGNSTSTTLKKSASSSNNNSNSRTFNNGNNFAYEYDVRSGCGSTVSSPGAPPGPPSSNYVGTKLDMTAEYQRSQALNSLTWRKAIRQASVRNLSWKDQMALRECQDKSSSVRLQASKSVSKASTSLISKLHKRNL